MNPYTSGIAKFNTILAERLSIPYRPLFSEDGNNATYPILSFKAIELDGYETEKLNAWVDQRTAQKKPFAFFFHVYSGTPIELKIAQQASAVYCGNAELHALLSQFNTNCHSLTCPGTLMEGELFKPTEITLFTFGMAHKIRARRYQKLKRLLDESGKTYSIYISTAMHQSTDFFEALRVTREEMHEIFGDKIYFMGYLSDMAVYNYLHQCNFLVAFFEKGIRANNTSVNAALATGAVVITNLDEHSPPEMKDGQNIVNIDSCEALPTDPHQLKEISVAARKLGVGPLGWDGLVNSLRPDEKNH